MRVYLTGFSASGKTSVGRLLARRLNARFVDVDRCIERQSGMTITEIFSLEGEAVFRRREYAEIVGVHGRAARNLVVALGGGAVQNPAVRKLLRHDGVTIYLSCSVREIYRRLRTVADRPLLNVPLRTGETHIQARKRRICALLSKRKKYYRRADLVISTTTKTPSQAADQLYRLIRRYDARH